MSVALAAAAFDAHVWWSTADKFDAARYAVDSAREQGLPTDQWVTWVATLRRAQDEVPPDVETARAIYISAHTWDEPGAPDWQGQAWSDAKDAVGGAIGSTTSTIAGTVVPLLWGALIVLGIYGLSKLKGAA